MEELNAYRKDLLAALEGVVEKLFQVAAAMPSGAWHKSLGSDGHTPHYTLAHLGELEAQVFVVRLRRILDEESPLLPLFDDEAWMLTHYKPDEPPQSIIEDYARLCQEELGWLRDLPPAAWNRTARHPWWGVHALQWWVELELEYAHQHLSQLTANLTA
jgi:DinB superfamily